MIFGGASSGGRNVADAGSTAGSAAASMSRKRTPSAPRRITSATSLAAPANGTRPCSVSAPTCCLPLIAKVASFISVSLVVPVVDGQLLQWIRCRGRPAFANPKFANAEPSSQAPEASIDDQGLARHEGGIVGGEERRHAHEVSDFAAARDRLQLREKGDLV